MFLFVITENTFTTKMEYNMKSNSLAPKLPVQFNSNAHQMKNSPDNLLDSLYIQLLNQFKMYNSKGNNLFCSYMSVGQKYQNELLIIGREPNYWPACFSPVELTNGGEVDVFRTKVINHALLGKDSLNPFLNTSYNSILDPYWCCIKEIVIKLGICKDETNWSSGIALTYLYKIAYSSNRYLPKKSRKMQFEHCREILHHELLLLRPKRVLFLTGMKHAQDFLYLSDCSGLEDCVCPLGDFDYEFDKVKTVVSVHPKKYHRKELVDLILAGFRGMPI